MDGERNLILVAEHRLLRECLAFALADSKRWKVTAEEENLGQIVQKLADLSADVLLVDLTLPQDRLSEHLWTLRRQWPDTRILLLGPQELEEEFLPLLEAGASGYLSLECSLSELEDALERVHRDEPLVSPRVAYALFSRLGELGRERARQQQVEALVLTPREFQVLQLVSQGCSNRQIAKELQLSVCTIKNHIHNILEKLGVDRRRQAVEVAIEHRWLPDPRRREVRPVQPSAESRGHI